MGVKRWKTKAVGTTEWASVMREAKAILKRAVVLKEKKRRTFFTVLSFQKNINSVF
jgi:hypothetical protein